MELTIVLRKGFLVCVPKGQWEISRWCNHRNRIRVDPRVLKGRRTAAVASLSCAPSGREPASACVPVVSPPANFRRASGAKHFAEGYSQSLNIRKLTAAVRILISAALVVVFTAAAAAKERKLYPVDEGEKDASFSAFRDRLLKAASERDKKFLLSVIDPQIKWSFGDNHGSREFRRHWKIDGDGSGLWGELINVLSLGGTFSTSGGRKEFCAPYTFTRFPDDLDAFEYAAIVGKDVRVRAQPNADAPIVAALSYDLVKAEFPENDGATGWAKVTTPNGEQGYVLKKFVRSPVDYRACFRNTKGKWLMTLFIAGD